MSNKSTILPLAAGLAAAAAVGLSTPASAAAISDSMTVWDPTGAVAFKTLAMEPDDPDTFYTTPVAVDVTQFGNPTVLLEPNGRASDIFGVCTLDSGATFTLCFNSDSETVGPNFGPFPRTFPEGDGKFDATLYLDPALQAAGWTAQFQSDVPEPATWAMMLLGIGAMGWSLRRRVKAATA
jgi:hypothetical protein